MLLVQQTEVSFDAKTNLRQVMLSDLDVKAALDLILGLAGFRSKKRRELLEEEIEKVFLEGLAAQSYFIKELIRLKRNLEDKGARAEQLTQRNDVNEKLDAILSDIDNVLDEIDARRDEGRADRKSVARISDRRAGKEYFSESIMGLITEEEGYLIKELHEGIANFFRYADRSYNHALGHYVNAVRYDLEKARLLMMRGPNSRTIQEIAKCFEHATLNISNGISDAEDSYAEVKALHDEVKRRLSGR